jgi:CheY-like chemotaxis protein
MPSRVLSLDYPDLDIELRKIEELLGEVNSRNVSLELLDAAIEEASKNSKLSRAARDGGVRATKEFARIASLPRRVWSEDEASDLAQAMTTALRQPNGKLTLRPSQAIALCEIGLSKGLLGPLRAGAGKSLVSFLAPTVLGSKHPVLVVPAKLVEKTKVELREYLKHFRCAYHLTIISYEILSRVSQAGFFDLHKPDLVILDEAHKAKNPRAAVTRRIKRYVESSRVPVIALSGTVTKRSLHDYGHLAKWALRDGSPLPLHFPDLEEWANALDERPRAAFRTAPGALAEFSDGYADIERVREGFARRIVETPGVVATNDKLVGCSLQVTRWQLDPPPVVDEAFRKLRREWVMPDGWEILDAMQLAQKARQIGLGFCYEYLPWPPKPWAEARSAWAKFVRDILKTNRKGLDTELQVAQACSKGALPREAFDAWRAIKKSFTPNRVTRWLDSFALDAAQEWLAADKSAQGKLVWCDHIEFAERLSDVSGLPYCGAGGVDKHGKRIEEYSGEPLIVSIQSSGEGRNLQAWNKSLIVSPPSSGLAWEQALARTHRDGQLADEVSFDVLVTCIEHEGAVIQALNDAEYRTTTTQQPDRLTYCDLSWPTLQTRRPATSEVASSLFAWNK